MKLIIKSSTVAKKRLVAKEQLSDEEKLNFPSGSVLEVEKIIEGGQRNWLVELIEFPGKWFFYKSHCEIKNDTLLSYKEFKACLPDASNEKLKLFYEPLMLGFERFEINTKLRIAAFLAQVAHESNSLQLDEEEASGAVYEYSRDLGNIRPGDGCKYKARGIFKLRGKTYYEWASQQLEVDLVDHPKKAKDPVISSQIACLYWHSKNLNQYADANTLEGFRAITRQISGGYNGWKDPLKHWNVAKKALFV